MPVTIKAANLKYKDSNGEYVGVNSISDQTTAEQLAAINTAGTQKVNAVNAAGTTQVAAVNLAGTTHTAAINNAGTTQVSAVNSAGANQVSAVNTKGQEVLESIPEDYSTLSDEVDSLLSAIDSAPTEETGAELLAEEERNTALLIAALDNIDYLIAHLPNNDSAMDIVEELQTENSWLDMIYNEMVVREMSA